MLAKVARRFKGRGRRCLQFDTALRYMAAVQRLVAYLRDHVFIDFQGDLDVEKVRELLAGDDSRDARELLARLTRERGTSDVAHS